MKHPTLAEIIEKWPEEMKQLASGEISMFDLPEELNYDLYLCYFYDMPYGTQKARTGDPYEFIDEALQNEPEFIALA